MSRESEFYAVMTNDSTLMTTLTGGVYKSEDIGRAGITRDVAPAAFTSQTGPIKPLALIVQRGLVPQGTLRDHDTKQISGVEVVEVYLYEDRLYVNIDAAISRMFYLFQGRVLTNSFPIEWINTINRKREEGTLKGASLARMDWQIHSVIQGV